MLAEQLPFVVETARTAVALPREWVGIAAVVIGTTLAGVSAVRRFVTRSVANERDDDDSERQPRSPPRRSNHRTTVRRVEERTGR
ncbi:hypothetical protein CDG81_10935 [Actinopolyspora erythraea]|uniref:Uncharacterized protein n=1 Tax=Actinopolyspora erythraea TaxID=414996 RepID=A0A099D6K1_9ACTN|nr:hypothetical protein CDG81_10935 [Actinopolyspora erythraea]KGI81462.1 hypothetical protein IL38_10995 [Actinopolyspora erythraea]